MIIDPRLPSPANRGPISPKSGLPDHAPIDIHFRHGLGDNVYFAHLLPSYLRRGIPVRIKCHPSMRLIYQAAGAELVDHATTEHLWGYPDEGTPGELGVPWKGSKLAHNLSEPPLPNIGTKSSLWQEYASTRIDIRPHLPPGSVETARAWLANLPRPIVLLHSKGTTAQARKSLPDAVTSQFYAEFLDRCDGTLLLLDWDDRVPTLASSRVRHIKEFGRCTLDMLLALMTQSDLMIGVDSGPLHVARFTSIPTIGVWRPGHYPQTYTLPRPEQLNIVVAGQTRHLNRYHRIPWNIVEQPGDAFDAGTLADFARQMLSPARYRGIGILPVTQAQDVQLQQFIRDFTRCRGSTFLAAHWDRQRSLDVLFSETAKRFPSPTIIETGTIRSEEDWGGAGFFTYAAATFVHRHGGRLLSVDLSPDNVSFSRKWTANFGSAVAIHHGDSVRFLSDNKLPIDVLYLDSLDSDDPNCAAHCSHEIAAALPLLREQSLICIDDTPWKDGAFTGKGASAVPWLLINGWRILYAGYQVVLERGNQHE